MADGSLTVLEKNAKIWSIYNCIFTFCFIAKGSKIILLYGFSSTISKTTENLFLYSEDGKVILDLSRIMEGS